MNTVEFVEAANELLEEVGAEDAIKVMCKLLGDMALAIESGFDIEAEELGWKVEVTLLKDGSGTE